MKKDPSHHGFPSQKRPPLYLPLPFPKSQASEGKYYGPLPADVESLGKPLNGGEKSKGKGDSSKNHRFNRDLE